MSTDEADMNAHPPPSWHQQHLPVPSWLVLAALAFFGPGDTVAGTMLATGDYDRLAVQVETLAGQVEILADQVDELRDTDGEVAHVLAEVVRALDNRE